MTKRTARKGRSFSFNGKAHEPGVTVSLGARTLEEGATKYQVRYGRQGKYYYKTCKHIDSDFTKTYTYLNNRTSGKTYYIKVRSITEMPDGTIVYGNWSPVQKIKSK